MVRKSLWWIREITRSGRSASSIDIWKVIRKAARRLIENPRLGFAIKGNPGML
jgi:hypothetical protein